MVLTKKDFIKQAERIAQIKDMMTRETKIKEAIVSNTKSNPQFNEGIFRSFIDKRRSGKEPSKIIKFSAKTKVTNKGDAWGRGRIEQPVYAVAGVNDTGSWSDSPCPSVDVKKELDMIKKELAQAGVPTKEFGGSYGSSNVFMGRRWLVAPKNDFPKAKKLANKLLKKHEKETEYIYGAD